MFIINLMSLPITLKQKVHEKQSVNNRNEVIEICRNEFKTISRWIQRNHGTEEDSEDVFYDAILILLDKLDSGSLTLNCELSTYFFSICKHLWFHECRKRNKLKLSGRINDIYIDNNYDDREDRKYQLFIEILNKPDDRSIELFKHLFANRSFSEIADISVYYAKKISQKRQITSRLDLSSACSGHHGFESCVYAQLRCAYV